MLHPRCSENTHHPDGRVSRYAPFYRVSDAISERQVWQILRTSLQVNLTVQALEPAETWALRQSRRSVHQIYW